MFSILLPTFLLAGVGWALGRLGRVPARPLAQVAFWVLSPALIFESLRTADLTASGTVVLFALAHLGAMFALSLGVGRILFGSDRAGRAVASLVLTFGNCGNLGLPILLFAYRQGGVDVGIVFLTAHTVLLATLGVAVAAWDEQGGRRIWGTLLRVPWLYAVGAAFLVRGVGMPAFVARATGLLAGGAIPLFLILLGLELAQVRGVRVARPALALSLLRLVGGAALAWVLASAFRVQGLLRGSLIVEGSVPTAVNAFLLASQYNRRPDLAASVLFLSTVLSVATLPLTLFLLAPGG
ncbi:MAG: AEC family transporter [Candidatus Bipolaricaulota bacterium]